MLTTNFLQLRPTILPVSSDCNLRCGYCYCHRGKKDRKHLMRSEVLEIILKKFIDEYPNFISFCWHGGEPLLAGLSFFREICRIQEKHKSGPQVIENRLQTNAVLLNQEWANFFKEFDFNIGISIDGPEWLNDGQRFFKNEQGSYSGIAKGIDLLHANEIPFSALITVSRENVKFPEEIYDFVIKEGFTTVKFNPCFGNHKLSVDFIDYSHFMNRIFDLWFNEDRVELSVGPTEDIIEAFLGGSPNICHMRSTCYRHVKIDYNGDVIPCDAFLGKDFKFGNILNQEIVDIINGNRYLAFFNAVKEAPSQCLNCKWHYICGGGCSRYSLERNLRKKQNQMCESKKIMFEHIAQAIEK